MAKILWRGDAPAVAKVDRVTVAGTWATNDTATLTCNGKSVTFTVAGTQTVAAVVAGLVALWNASTVTEHAEVTAADANPYITLTADTAGKPFTITTSEVTAGDGTLSLANLTASSGPADLAVAANFQGGSLPVDDDELIYEDSNKDCLYNLDALDDLVTLSVTVWQSYTGKIGLPKISSGGYIEYRPQYLTAGITALDVGGGEGSGSTRLQFDLMAVVAASIVRNTGSAQSAGTYPLLIKNGATGSSLKVMKGVVGVAVYAGEAAYLDGGLTLGYITNQRGDAKVVCGSGVVLDDVTKIGGYLLVASNVGDVVNHEGELHTTGNMTADLLRMFGGVAMDQSSGTFALVEVHSGAAYDYRRGVTAKTVTTMDLKKGAKYYDPAGLVTATNGLKLTNCAEFQTLPDIAWTPA